MSKRENKVETLKRTSYTQHEIDQVKKECNGDFSKESRERWLVSRGAIRIKQYLGHPNVVVVQAADGSFPYSSLSDLWEETLKSVRKSEFANQKSLEFHESLANQMSVDVV